MEFSIKSFRAEKECGLIAAYLDWQGVGYSMELVAPEVAKVTRGKPGVAVYYPAGVVFVVGFHQFYKRFREERMERA